MQGDRTRFLKPLLDKDVAEKLAKFKNAKSLPLNDFYILDAFGLKLKILVGLRTCCEKSEQPAEAAVLSTFTFIYSIFYVFEPHTL
ncbi:MULTISPECIES: hypothetical protein [unclassified Nostoc]|uniref:hypothetical protein n=1 Tax=unclassified Nostoc TaxID=2593658 RepID=UPI0025EA3FA0|nr:MULTISPECIES: hypothetical protein [unclassified Nostoc]